MSTPPATQPRQTALKGLKLPITGEHFHSLSARQQNDPVAEQVMGWQLYEWDEECSGYTPGAEWQYGSDHYALPCPLWAPAHLDTMLETDEEALLNWEEGYGSRDWVTDIGAAMQLLEVLANQEPAVCKYTPNDAVPRAWCCRLFRLNSNVVCWHGAMDFEELPTAIVLACLEAIGVIDNSPLANTPYVEELVLQATVRGPAPSHNIDCRYDYKHQTWIITETTCTLDGEDTDYWTTQYRDGHYVFHAV